MIPAPDGAEPDKPGDQQTQGKTRGGNAGQRQQRHSKKSSIPSPEDCLWALAQIPGLLAMGMLKPAQANAICSSYREILRHHKDKAKEAESGLASADVMDLLRKNPQMLSLLEPLLTEEQVALVMKAVGSGGDGRT